MMPFLKLTPDARSPKSKVQSPKSEVTKAETCWLGFAAGCAFMFLVITIVHLATR